MMLPADPFQAGDQILVHACEITGRTSFRGRLRCAYEAFTLVDSRKQARRLTSSTRGSPDLDHVAHADAPGLDKIDDETVGPVAEFTGQPGEETPEKEVEEL